jgi:hypothetical protein
MSTDQKTHNQPSHEAQVKGGEHSHQGKHQNESNESSHTGNRTPPSREEASKGGQHSHSGGNH